MAVEASQIETLIKEHIPDSEVRIKDLRGDGDHYAAYVCAESFRGLTRLQQQRMVMAAVKPLITKTLHALAVHTSIPDNA